MLLGFHPLKAGILLQISVQPASKESIPFPQNDGLKYSLHVITCKTAWHYM